MKIAVFHNKAQVGSAWCCAEGLVECLNGMGYSAVDFGNPKQASPSLDTLRGFDAILMGGPEWFFNDISSKYGMDWNKLKAIKVAWYSETSERDDCTFPYFEYREYADLHYFPAIQDATTYSGYWLPFGVDTSIFKYKALQKTTAVGFVGSIYPKREAYLSSIGASIIILPQVSAPSPRASADLLASVYNSIDIFVNLPSYSRLLVTKVTEVMACNTFLITPKIDHITAIYNGIDFETGKHLIYYDSERPQELLSIIDYYLKNPLERDRIAFQGWSEVINKHTLRRRLSVIVRDIRNRLSVL